MLQRSPYLNYKGGGLGAALTAGAQAAPQTQARPAQAGNQAQAGAQGQSSSGERANAGIASSLEVILARLEDIIDQETTALTGRGSIDLKDFNDRKTQALLDLSRVLKHLSNFKGDQALQKRLLVIQGKLAQNSRILKMHLEAVREISSTLTSAIRDSESDGTYSHKISAVFRQ